MTLIVKKFGGSSVATPEKMFAIVDRVLRNKKEDDRIVIVVSAMGDTTDDLVSLAKKVTHKPYGREMDMLLATGEQMSIALMAMAFEEKGHPAVSFTGPQAGIKTTASFNKGRILTIDPSRVEAALDEGKIVIVAGFQGITQDGDITTLGRGGSDTTAVALAGAMNADVCEIFTDVSGVYSTDPRVAKNAMKIEEITYGEMLEMARLGAGVMQPRAVEMGSRYGVPIHVRSTFSEEEGTIIKEELSVEYKDKVITGVTDDDTAAKVALIDVENQPGIAHNVFKLLADENIVVDMIVQSIREGSEDKTDIVFTINQDDVPQTRAVLESLKERANFGSMVIDENVAKVSIVGAGMLGRPGVAADMFGILGTEGINIEIISTSEISISCLVAQDRVKDAVRAIHDKFLMEGRG